MSPQRHRIYFGLIGINAIFGTVTIENRTHVRVIDLGPAFIRTRGKVDKWGLPMYRMSISIRTGKYGRVQVPYTSSSPSRTLQRFNCQTKTLRREETRLLLLASLIVASLSVNKQDKEVDDIEERDRGCEPCW
jgi:hypothetical protein